MQPNFPHLGKSQGAMDKPPSEKITFVIIVSALPGNLLNNSIDSIVIEYK